jgi:hypothetical protein
MTALYAAVVVAVTKEQEEEQEERISAACNKTHGSIMAVLIFLWLS